jgi:hypothetical protein
MRRPSEICAGGILLSRLPEGNRRKSSAEKGDGKVKRKQGNYLHLSRKLFNDPEFQQLSLYAKWLYVVLNELEHRFTGAKKDFFFRSNEELAEDSGMSISQVKRAKDELRPLVQMWKMHWIDERGKKSRKYVTAYRIRER